MQKVSNTLRFQSTHPRGVRLLLLCRNIVRYKFQSTHPRGVRLVIVISKFTFYVFQSTHPRGVRLPCGHCVQCLEKFQSTHPRGVRHIHNTKSLCNSSFNPRTHEGCDPSFAFGVSRFYHVSIHAPTRGATLLTLKDVEYYQFQSTHPRGVRRPEARKSLALAVSIHAPTRGATVSGQTYYQPKTGFNPRTHEGCDLGNIKPCSDQRVSIHAPTRGATKFIVGNAYAHTFQSTHPRGVRLDTHESFVTQNQVSIHAPTRGATLIWVFCSTIVEVSIHAPTRGATRTKRAVRINKRFQSTHPRGVRQNTI